MRWIAVVGLSGVLACADDEARSDSGCGDRASRHLLTLDPGVRVFRFGGARTRIGDRVYFIVAAYDPDGVGYGPTTVLSTEPCGGEARVVASEIGRVFSDERWPDLALGERSGSEPGIVVLDPTGEDPPRLFIASARRSDLWARLGIVGRRASTTMPDGGLVQLTSYPFDESDPPTEPIVLRDGIVDAADALAVVADAVFVVALPDRTLLRHDLVDGSWDEIAPRVESLMASDDDRWLVWREVPEPPHEIPADDAPTATHALDLVTGERVSLGSTVALLEVRWDRLVSGNNGEYGFPSALTDLRSGEAQTFPMFQGLSRGLTPDLWFGSGFGTHFIYDSTADTWAATFESDGATLVAEDHLIARVVPFDNPMLGELSRIDFDTLEPRVVALRASADYREIEDGRILTRVGLGEDEIRTLVVVDPISLEETPLDDDVRRIGDEWWIDAGDGSIAYEIERDGLREVWLAQP